MIKRIEADGWVLARTRGSHRQYKHPVKAGVVTVPPWRQLMRDTEMPSYLIVIERAADGGYGAWAPDLPGCVALGDTIEECQREMREAVAFHLEGLREEGAPIPPPSAVAAAMVAVPAA